ncbi:MULTISPECIES: hypothetical protein [Bacteria]|jgi:hypothetical protein|uniref:Uncharacterized protein n=2 Tax=Lactobacillus crispatus TaxID=47770 RepID=A0A109DQV9_9LACO|nr:MULTISPECIES: hypothetical protein [Lactobacillus]MCT7767708.1 hypothetical protein [Lactobacillus iners]CPR46598.1 Uncharacterised protein [Chlamydia trachomatis]ALZ45654.1 hypothetical protein [Lactobacillus crispatus]AZR15936.1 hypothetical protein C3K22_08125 [Lactobacillus crispatus]AZR16715.1 hypothetical protein C3K22_12180 [Lactobacillus crispatus]
MVKVLIRGISEQNLARIDRIVNQLNQNSSKKISRNQFLREQIEQIPINFQNQNEDSQTSLLIQKQNKLLQENLLGLNVLAKYFISGDVNDTERALNLLDSLSEDTAKEDD